MGEAGRFVSTSFLRLFPTVDLNYRAKISV